MQARALRLILATTAFAFTLAACSSEEEPGGGHDTPESVKLFDAATHTELPQPYALPSGATTRVEVHFYNSHGEDINDELIAEHFTSLTFDPGTFATVSSVTDLKFQRDVLVNADPGATSQLTVGYGHDEAADSRSFGPYTVTASEAAPAARIAGR
jgi:hypothetical protein